jgi:cytochrome c2
VNNLKYIFYISIIIITFLSGYFFHKNKFFPYPQLYETYIYFLEKVKTYNLNSKQQEQVNNKTLLKNNKRASNINNVFLEPIKSETIETQTLPLSKIIFNTNKIFNNPSSEKGGALCANKNDLILVNGSAEILILNPKKNKVLKYLDLNEQVSKIETNLFKVNDILCYGDSYGSGKVTVFLSVDYVLNKSKNDLSEKTNKTYLLKVVHNVNKNQIFVTTIWSGSSVSPNIAGRIVSNNFKDFYISFSGPTRGELLTDELLTNDTLYPEQDLNPLILDGKIVKINTLTNFHKIYSYGHRNPQGLFIDNDSSVYSTEHGPMGGDELNIIIDGSNYGWPLSSHGVGYYSYRPIFGKIGRHEKFKKPIFSWGPGIGISNLERLHGFNKAWDGDFLITSLKNKSLYRVRLRNTSVDFVEKIWIGHRLRDIAIKNSKIYFWTDDKKLILLKVENYIDRHFSGTEGPHLNACLYCHHLGVTNSTHVAPSLYKIFGRKAGSDPNFEYSAALKNSDFLWTDENMFKFIVNPKGFLPGTTMSYSVSDTKTALDTIERLKKASKMPAL